MFLRRTRLRLACNCRLLQQGAGPLESLYLPRIHTQLLPDIVAYEDWSTQQSGYHLPAGALQVWKHPVRQPCSLQTPQLKR